MSRRAWVLAPAWPLLAYVTIAVALARAGPALEYDEALFQAGAVHLLTSTTEPNIPHALHTWVQVGGRPWPLMLMPYAGAPSVYLLLPVFALFGPAPWVARTAAAVFGAVGLWGVGRLAAKAAGASGGAAALWILAVHPGLLSNTVFNDSGFAYWLMALGLVALALRAYLERPGAAWAAAVGLACGFGVWGRLNFLWVLVAAAVGALAGFGRRALPPVRHVAVAAAGAIVGGAPLLSWFLLTRLRVTLDYLSTFDTGPLRLAHVRWRLRALADALLYDGEHRRWMWDGPALPTWQVAFVSLLAAAGVLAAFAARHPRDDVDRWHRAIAVGVVFQAVWMLFSRLPVREHHLLTLVPPLAVAVVLAGVRLLRRRPRAGPALAAVAVVYAVVALSWDVAMHRGLLATGGRGAWSDAMDDVARYLETRGITSVAVLDWGYGTGLLVSTRGTVQPTELFWPYAAGEPVEGPLWRNQVVPGRVFLTHAPGMLYYEGGRRATARFEKALARSGLSASRLVFNDRRGVPHSVLIEIAP